MLLSKSLLGWVARIRDKKKLQKNMVKAFLYFRMRLITKSLFCIKKNSLRNRAIREFVIRRLAREKVKSKVQVFGAFK